MGFILFPRGQRSMLRAWLGGAASEANVLPAAGGNFGLGLGTASTAALTSASTISTINEIGGDTAAGYERQPISRDEEAGSGWSVPTGTPLQTTAAEVTFSFSGAPDPNGANMWFIAASGTEGADDVLWGADTAAVRTYNTGDIERVVAAVSVTYSP